MQKGEMDVVSVRITFYAMLGIGANWWTLFALNWKWSVNCVTHIEKCVERGKQNKGSKFTTDVCIEFIQKCARRYSSYDQHFWYAWSRISIIIFLSCYWIVFSAPTAMGKLRHAQNNSKNSCQSVKKGD